MRFLDILVEEFVSPKCCIVASRNVVNRGHSAIWMIQRKRNSRSLFEMLECSSSGLPAPL